MHNDYPLALDKIKIKQNISSDYQLKFVDVYNILIANAKRLMRNVFDKEKFVIHYENLQFYLRLGLKLKEIHRVLELNQSKLAKAEEMVTKMEKHCTN